MPTELFFQQTQGEWVIKQTITKQHICKLDSCLTVHHLLGKVI